MCNGGQVRGIRKILNIFVLLVLLLGTIFSPVGFNFKNTQKAKASGDHNIDDATWCGATLNNDTEPYLLMADITCPAGNGLVIGADNITIDGGNHSLTGSGIGNPGSGILNDGWINITIQNFTNITGFQYGIKFVNSTGGPDGLIRSTIQNITANTNESGIFVYSSSSVDIKDNIANKNFGVGVYLAGSSSVTVEGNTTDTNTHEGIAIAEGSFSNIVENNTARGNEAGIHISDSSDNTITDNISNFNNNGIVLSSIESPLSNHFNGNTSSSNRYGLRYSGDFTGSGNTYGLTSPNQFVNNIYDEMLAITAPAESATRKYAVGNTIGFDIQTFNADGTDCSYTGLSPCIKTLTTSPTETISSSVDSGDTNRIIGSFTPTRSGTYSLIINITDSNGNTTKRNLIFLVGATSTKNTTYYYRTGRPSHDQPWGNGEDSQLLTLTAPSSVETGYCAIWTQNSPDVLPDYPLAYMTGINLSLWYKYTSGVSNNPYVGTQRFVDYATTVDQSDAVDFVDKYTWFNKNFTGLTWAMDSTQSWYWLSLKLHGFGNNPTWTTFPASADEADPASWAAHQNDPSNAVFTYDYTTTPAVKSITNEDISVLSATAPVTDSSDASIVLDGTGSTNLVLNNYKRPFSGYTTTINADGTATLAATGLSDVTTINSVKMDIVPDAGSVATTVTTWNTGADGSYSKTWTETGSGGVTSAPHVIGDLMTDKYYTVSTNGWSHTYKATGGEISFTYDGGYSTHTFDLTANADATVNPLSYLPQTGGGPVGDQSAKSYPWLWITIGNIMISGCITAFIVRRKKFAN